MLLIPLLSALTLAGLPDRGIWPDLDAQVQIAAAPWVQAEGPASVRVDLVHGVVTVYRGDAPQVAYAVAAPVQAASVQAVPRTVPEVLALVRAEDRAALAGLVPMDAAVRVGAPLAAEDHDGDGIVNSLDILVGAKRLCLNKAAYSEHYRGMKYPGGDVPRNEGVCTDTLVRAMRNAGWDLQREVHEEAQRYPGTYPLERGKRLDANIDHRRVRMLVPWFRRHFQLVAPEAPMRPGDIVFLDTFPSKAGPDHLGIVSDRLGASGKPLIVNNWTDGYVEKEMDLLPFVPVVYRYRAP